MIDATKGTTIVADGPFMLSDEECRARSDNHLMDIIEAWLAEQPEAELPVTHRFVPGMYAREIFMQRDAMVTSKIHKTRHLFVISRGSVSVWTQQSGVVRLAAPYTGVTEPGTRRLLFVHDDCIWTTFHPTDRTNVAEIETEIILPHPPPHKLTDDDREAVAALIEQWRSISCIAPIEEPFTEEVPRDTAATAT